MAVLDLVHYGNPILRKKCKLVDDFSDLSKFVEDMYDTMYEEEGLGLAANQVGIDMNLFVIDISHIDENEFQRLFINGEIISGSGESYFSEGCLSIPEITLEVKRPETIIFKYQDINGDWIEEEFNGLLARAIQHEIDHLNGVLIIDRVSDIKKISIGQELKKIKEKSEIKMRQKSENQGFVI